MRISHHLINPPPITAKGKEVTVRAKVLENQYARIQLDNQKVYSIATPKPVAQITKETKVALTPAGTGRKYQRTCKSPEPNGDSQKSVKRKIEPSSDDESETTSNDDETYTTVKSSSNE